MTDATEMPTTMPGYPRTRIEHNIANAQLGRAPPITPASAFNDTSNPPLRILQAWEPAMHMIETTAHFKARCGSRGFL